MVGGNMVIYTNDKKRMKKQLEKVIGELYTLEDINHYKNNKLGKAVENLIEIIHKNKVVVKWTILKED